MGARHHAHGRTARRVGPVGRDAPRRRVPPIPPRVRAHSSRRAPIRQHQLVHGHGAAAVGRRTRRRAGDDQPRALDDRRLRLPRPARHGRAVRRRRAARSAAPARSVHGGRRRIHASAERRSGVARLRRPGRRAGARPARVSPPPLRHAEPGGADRASLARRHPHRLRRGHWRALRRALARGGVGLQRARAGRSASRLRPRAARFLRRPSVAAAPSHARAAGVGGPARGGRAGVRRGPALRHRPRHRLGQLRAPGGRGPPRGGHARLGQQHRAGTTHARRSARRHSWSHPAGHPVRARRAQRETVARAAHSRTAVRRSSRSARFRAVTCASSPREAACNWGWAARCRPRWSRPLSVLTTAASEPASQLSPRSDPRRLSGRACPRRSSAAAEAFFQ